MGAEGAAKIIFRREIQASTDSKSEESKKIAEYREKFANPYHAASRGYVDDVIEPSETRPRLIACLEVLRTKRDKNPPRKHGNIPL
jgi:propionyl-CoA carboxylase beta chain